MVAIDVTEAAMRMSTIMTSVAFVSTVAVAVAVVSTISTAIAAIAISINQHNDQLAIDSDISW
jgi:hypothetical protein